MAFSYVNTLTDLKAIAVANDGLTKFVLDVEETGRTPAQYVYREPSSLGALAGIVEPSTNGLSGQWIKMTDLVYFDSDTPSNQGITPPFKGINYVDTTNAVTYISVGSFSSSDWMAVTSSGGSS